VGESWQNGNGRGGFWNRKKKHDEHDEHRESVGA